MPKPMKLTDVGQSLAPMYIANDEYLMQQKLDGARVMCVVTPERIVFTNDGTNEIAFAAARQALPTLTFEMNLLMAGIGLTHARLDGELIVETGEYWVFDMLEARHREQGDLIAPDDALSDRLVVLGRLGLGTEHIHRTPTAYTREQKQALWDSVIERGVEGAVSKHIDSPYTYGIRSTQWVKHKLVKTADVEVVAAQRTFKPSGIVETGSAVLRVPITPEQDPKPWMYTTKRGARKRYSGKGGQFTGGEWTYEPRTHLVVGAASLIGKDLQIDEGTVVEVAYLYFTGEAMVQPRILRMRSDKTADECSIDQFAPYTREVIR